MAPAPSIEAGWTLEQRGRAKFVPEASCYRWNSNMPPERNSVSLHAIAGEGLRLFHRTSTITAMLSRFQAMPFRKAAA